jgi:hypothetical protein
VIAFGFLDSQSLFSTMSNVRLDGFVYTVQSMQSAWSKLADDGWLVVSFFTPTPWLPPKIAQMLREATGVEPICYAGMNTTAMCVPKKPGAIAPDSFGEFQRTTLQHPPMDVPTDDWPYLYLSRKTIPGDYVIVIGILLLVSVIGVGLARGVKLGRGDAHFFLLGFGFLLLQTKSITDCSLYFGATWFITSIVIIGVLLMVLLANMLALRLERASSWYYLPLVLSLLVLYVVPRDFILAQPFVVRLAWVILVVPLPIFFAGLVFSTTFRRAPDPAMAFGTNLRGATIGGFAEYLGMAFGSNALSLLVMAAYVASLASQRFGASTSFRAADTSLAAHPK